MSQSPIKSTSTAALTRFRLLAVLCGVNLLLLIFAYMPAKYLFDAIEENKWLIAIPIAHGYLYIVYILTALQIGVQKRMRFLTILWLLAASWCRHTCSSECSSQAARPCLRFQ